MVTSQYNNNNRIYIIGCHMFVECNVQPHTWLKDRAATTDERLCGSYSSEHQKHLSLHNSKLLCHHP